MITRRALPIAVSLSLASALVLGGGLASAEEPKAAPPAEEPRELVTRSPEMVVGGVLLGIAGTAAVTAGLFYATNYTLSTPPPGGSAAFIPPTSYSPPTSQAKIAGGSVAAVGVLGIAGGLALAILGAKKVPSTKTATAMPSVALGVKSAALAWSF